MRSMLVTRAFEAALAARPDDDLEIVSSPVDLDERAVVICDGATPLIVKIDTDVARANRERAALDLVRAAAPAVTVPAELFADEGVTGLSFIAGERVDRIGAWASAGEQLAALHAVPTLSSPIVELPTDEPPAVDLADSLGLHPSHPERLLAHVDEIAADGLALGVIDDQIAEAIKRVVRDRHDLVEPAAPTFVHGDASTEHFLCGVLGVNGVIDFGDAGIGDPAYDLAVLTLWHDEKLNDVLGDRDFGLWRDRIAAHRPVRLLAGANWLERHGYSPVAHRVALYDELLA